MKKFLSLVLALVMTMSLVTVSAGAKDFTDDSKITYQEAVDVMSEVDVIDGYADGSFQPTTLLTRGAAAKIICNLILGPTTAAALGADTAPYSDVPVNHTFAGYIAYCQKEGIISGYADGTFKPSASLTGYAFMKMLLGALGYDSSVEGYTGPNWSINVAKQAIAIGLAKGNDDFSGQAYVNREEAMLYAFNTLKATMVEYPQTTTVTVNGADVVLSSARAEVEWGTAKTNDGNIKADGYVQFAEKYFPDLEVKVVEGVYGRPSNKWLDSKKEIGTYTSIEPTFVYTDGAAEKDVYADLGKTIVEYDWTYYVDGVKDAGTCKEPAKSVKTDYAYTGEGSVTEIYVDDIEEEVTLVQYNYYLGQVSKVKTDDDGEYISVSVLSNTKLNDKTFYVEGFEEDDYVVFTRDENDDDDMVIAEVFEAATVTGEVTRVDKDDDSSNSYIRIDGEKHTYSDWNVYDVTDLGTTTHPTLTEDYIAYLDPNGFVLGFELAEEKVTNYLFVLDSHAGLRNEATVLLSDGTEVDVILDEIIKANNAKFGGSDVLSDEIEGRICEYTVDSNNRYDIEVLTKNPASPAESFVDTNWDKTTVGSAEIYNGRAYVTLSTGTTFIVDEKTVFVDLENNTAYTGYSEVPSVEKGKLAYVLDGKVAEIVFILDGEIYDSNTVYFVLADTDHESLKYDSKTYREYFNAYVDGEKTTLNIRYNALNGGSDETALSAGVLYEVKKTIDEDYIIDVDVAADAFKTVETVGSNAFFLTPARGEDYADNQYDVNADTVYMVVDFEEEVNKDGTRDIEAIYDGRLADMDDEDYDITVAVPKADKQTAELVVIKRVPKAEKSDDTSLKTFEVKGIDVVNGKVTLDSVSAKGAAPQLKLETTDANASVTKVEWRNANNGTSTWQDYAKSEYDKTGSVAGDANWTTSGLEFRVTVTAANGDTEIHYVEITYKAAYELTVKVDGVAGSARVQIGDKTYTLTTDGGSNDDEEKISVLAGESTVVKVLDKTTKTATVAGDSNSTVWSNGDVELTADATVTITLAN